LPEPLLTPKPVTNPATLIIPPKANARVSAAGHSILGIGTLAMVFYAGVMVALTSRSALAQSAGCAPPYKIDWPASNPVWSFCWVPPDNSSGVDGSGLELRNVFYK